MEPIYDQNDRNMVYSNNPLLLRKKRVKHLSLSRQKELMSERVKLAREYYKTITLNGKKTKTGQNG
jgi:hypothetical protein